MEKKIIDYELPVYGNKFTGLVFSLSQLSAKFQIWCRQFGINDKESLCLWMGKESKFLPDVTDAQVKAIASEAYAKLPESKEEVDLSGVS